MRLHHPVKSYGFISEYVRIFKPGMHGRRPLTPGSPGFLKLFRPRMLVYVCVCVCVCVSPPLRPLITSHMKGMRNNRVRQF